MILHMTQSRRAREKKQTLNTTKLIYAWSLEAKYNDADSWDAKLAAYIAAEKSMDAANPVFLARAAFELAAYANSPSAQNNLLLEAVERTALLAARPPVEPQQRIEAAIMHANLPILNLVHIQKTQPSLASVEKAHTQLARSMVGIAANVPKDSERRRVEFAGAAAEAYALINLQRFQTSQLRTADWVALPALLSEDNSPRIGSGVRHNWDVSVFSGEAENDLVHPAYKAQVKTTRNRLVDHHQEYSPDISLIYLRDDLQLPHEQMVPSLSVIGIAACALVVDSVSPKILATSEARVELLVSALDR
jgi:hypothetical protein